MLGSLYSLRLFLGKFHNFIDAWGEQGTCLHHQSSGFLVKHGLNWQPDTRGGWENVEKKMIIIFTSFSSTTIPLWWHTVCWLSSSLFLVFTFCYSKFLLPTGIGSLVPTFRVFCVEFQLLVLLPVFDVLSEQIVPSELLLRRCLSVSSLSEMTFVRPCLADQSPWLPLLQWFSFARAPALHPH